MTSYRDYQRSKLYHAEDVAFDKSKPAEFETLDECKAFAEQIINSKHWERHKGWKRVNVLDGRGRRCACFQANSKGKTHSIKLPRWARSRWIIIHEFAHMLTHRTHKGTAPHGAFFAGHYLALVEELLGDRAEFLLRSSFDTNGIKYRIL